jgi:hypothetical protein
MAPLSRPLGILGVVYDATEEQLPHTAYGSFPAHPTPPPTLAGFASTGWG